MQAEAAKVAEWSEAALSASTASAMFDFDHLEVEDATPSDTAPALVARSEAEAEVLASVQATLSAGGLSTNEADDRGHGERGGGACGEEEQVEDDPVCHARHWLFVPAEPAPTEETLEVMAAVEIQRRWRGIRVRKCHRAQEPAQSLKPMAAVKIQRRWRGTRVRDLQAAHGVHRPEGHLHASEMPRVRMATAVEEKLEPIESGMTIRPTIATSVRIRMLYMQAMAAIKIQRRWRGIRVRDCRRAQVMAAVEIQRRWRGIRVRDCHRAQVMAAVEIQRRWRGIRVRKCHRAQEPAQSLKPMAAVKIQRRWRGTRVRNLQAARGVHRQDGHLRASELYMPRAMAAIEIQRRWRGIRVIYCRRAQVIAAVDIQRRWRGIRVRDCHRAQVMAAVEIQRRWRGIRVRKCHRAQEPAQSLKPMAAVKIQRRWRGTGVKDLRAARGVHHPEGHLRAGGALDSARARARLAKAALEGAGAERAASECAAAVGAPLSYLVAPAGGNVLVREAPSLNAKVVGELHSGQETWGFPGGAWLRLSAGPGMDDGGGEPPQWALLDGGCLDPTPGQGLGSSLVATWSSVRVRSMCTGALQMEWTALPAAQAMYDIGWRVVAPERCRAVWCVATPASQCRMALHPPEGALVELRVDARLPAPRAGGPDVRLVGTWSKALRVPCVGEGTSSGKGVTDTLKRLWGRSGDAASEQETTTPAATTATMSLPDSGAGSPCSAALASMSSTSSPRSLLALEDWEQASQASEAERAEDISSDGGLSAECFYMGTPLGKSGAEQIFVDDPLELRAVLPGDITVLLQLSEACGEEPLFADEACLSQHLNGPGAGLCWALAVNGGGAAAAFAICGSDGFFGNLLQLLVTKGDRAAEQRSMLTERCKVACVVMGLRAFREWPPCPFMFKS